MDIHLNHGILKKAAEGERCPFVLKDFEGGLEIPITKTMVKIYEMQEGDIIEYCGGIRGDVTYIAISCIERRRFVN